MDKSGADSKFGELFVNIIKKGHKHSTYKFALARFLLDHSNENGSGYVQYMEIANRFFDYYWPQYYKYKLRQGPAKQPAVIGRIMDSCFMQEQQNMSSKDVRKKHPDTVAECIACIASECLDDVIPRFENIKSGEKAQFYEYNPIKEYRDAADNKVINPNGGIQIHPDAVNFLKRHYLPFYSMVILEWAKFLERFNPGLPYLASKTEGMIKSPRNQGKFKKILEKGNRCCFYCHCSLNPKTGTHVDHVIPMSYIGETELWNLVLTCQKCNCKKSDHLPPEKCLDALLRRNNELKKQKEYSLSLEMLRDWEGDISWHYDNASRQGYTVLVGFGRC